MRSADLSLCPRCGAEGCRFLDGAYWHCSSCGFTLYHNVAASASVILDVESRALMLVRGKEPRKGLLSLPGGFVNPDERAEDAAVRECLEETGLRVEGLSFVGSWPNDYEYCGILYKTCDIYFSARIAGRVGGDPMTGPLSALALDCEESSAFRLVSPADIEDAPIAFESARKALLAWRGKRA